MNEPTLPLWRVIIFENRYNRLEQFVCFYCDHALFDGISGLEFHKELLRELSNLSSDGHTDDLKLLSILFENNETPTLDICEIEEAREEMLDIFDVPLRYRLMNCFRSFFVYKWVSSFLTFSRGNLIFFGGSLAQDFDPYYLDLLNHSTFTYKPISKDLSTKFKTLTFNNAEVEKMLSFCKKSNLTLTPYFNIIALQCLQETLFAAVKDPNMGMFSTSSCVAVNGRRYYDLPYFLYGTLVGAEILNFGPMPSFSNKIRTMAYMKAAYLRLSTSLRNKNCFLSKGLQKKKNIWSFYSERIGKLEGKTTLVISNLGVFRNEANSGWKFENIWFGLNTGSLYHFILNLVTTQEKCLNLVFCYASEYEYLYNSASKPLLDEFLIMFTERVLLFPDV